MSLFDVLSKGFCSKKRESNEILSQEEYKDKFLHGDEYIKRELYDKFASTNRIDQAIFESEQEIANGAEAADAEVVFAELEKKHFG